MSTNYYYHVNICTHCERSSILHVGKKSHGWSFHFRAYRDSEDGAQLIASVADWERVFKTIPGVLLDEYQQIIPHPLQFLADLKRPTKAEQEDEDSPARRGLWAPNIDPEKEWRDPEGFAFYEGVFQ